MWEMLQNAWMGWQKYTDSGKMVALMLAVMLYLWLWGKHRGTKGRLLLYGGASAFLCICPLTAAVLMFYQTKFYDYQWIWSVVPLTALISLGGTMLLAEQWKPAMGWKNCLRNVIVTLASVMILWLCGGLGEGSVDAAKARENREHSDAVLETVRGLYGEDLCLWAPAEILENARLGGEMRLLYGRNMWDAALNAYSYDVYSKEQEELYLWMEQLDDWDIEISVAEVETYVEKGFSCGADCVLLPVEFTKWMQEPEAVLLERLGARDDVEVTELEGYYLLRLR